MTTDFWLIVLSLGIWGILLGGYVYAFFSIRKMIRQQKHWDRKNQRDRRNW